MSLEHLISQYGYWAVLIGSFLEGETVLLLGGLFAHSGYLDLFWVIVFAFIGSLTGDQLYFYIGRWKGMALIDKRPRWHGPAQKVFGLLQRHQTALILGFRFLYGIRTVTPFAIGASGISPLRFLILNVIGALVWAVVVGMLGYWFGHMIESLLGRIKHYELALLAGVLTLAFFAWWIRYRRMERQAMPPALDPKSD